MSRHGHKAIELSSADVNVDATRANPGRDHGRIGGLVGYNTVGPSHGMIRSIYRSYAIGDVTSNMNWVGGLVGYHAFSGATNNYIQFAYATGNVTGTGGGYATGGSKGVGGLIGHNGGGVIASYATGAVTGARDVGGLIGKQNKPNGWSPAGETFASYSTGPVTDTDDHLTGNAGGLVGWNNGKIINSYTTGVVTKTSNPDPNTAWARRSARRSIIRSCGRTWTATAPPPGRSSGIS